VVAGRRRATQPRRLADQHRQPKGHRPLRRENKRDDKHRDAQMAYHDDPPEPPGPIDDDRLRLIFACFHPALAMESRVR
jgi:predicted RNA polymerase sigma factor